MITPGAVIMPSLEPDGADSLEGGAGNDLFVLGDAGDVVAEAAAGGADTISANFDATLADEVEALLLTGTATIGTGNALGNRMEGNGADNGLDGLDGSDTLLGGAGADTLDGGLGADSLVGGTGNDAYFVDDAGDAALEAAGGGADTISASIDFTLVDEVEALLLTGTSDTSGTGNAQGNQISGNDGANRIDGLAGNDTLTGGGGFDTLAGGTDDDVYLIDDLGDSVLELAGEGADTIFASVSVTIDLEVERLMLVGAAGIGGTGNTQGNRIDGNAGNNLLAGLGGADALVGGGGADTLDGGTGADTLIGGTGDDAYIVDSVDDVVTELGLEGFDTVRSSINMVLRTGLEALVLTGGATDGTGNSLANLLVANDLGNGLVGGGGDDFYVIDQSDVVIELAGGGTADTLGVNFNVTLSGAYAEMEILLFTAASGSAALAGVGNAKDNRLIGSAGDNTLDGAEGQDRLFGDLGNNSLIGGAGNDTLTGDGGSDSLVGGAGADTFQFRALADSAAATPDVIFDFSPGIDQISVRLVDPSAAPGDQAFIWIGGGAFSGTGSAEARTFDDGTNTFAAFDIGDGGPAEMLLQVNGLVALSSGNFLL